MSNVEYEVLWSSVKRLNVEKDAPEREPRATRPWVIAAVLLIVAGVVHQIFWRNDDAAAPAPSVAPAELAAMAAADDGDAPGPAITDQDLRAVAWNDREILLQLDLMGIRFSPRPGESRVRIDGTLYRQGDWIERDDLRVELVRIDPHVVILRSEWDELFRLYDPIHADQLNRRYGWNLAGPPPPPDDFRSIYGIAFRASDDVVRQFERQVYEMYRDGGNRMPNVDTLTRLAQRLGAVDVGPDDIDPSHFTPTPVDE